MADADPQATQRDVLGGIPAELCTSGFDDVAEIGHGGFLREQRAMGRLSGHPHIVTILQVGTTPGGRPYIVMPCHGKGSLEALIRRHGPMDWCETLRIGVKLAGALEAAHRAGILHRDVKPGNVLLTEYGEPQLTD